MKQRISIAITADWLSRMLNDYMAVLKPRHLLKTKSNGIAEGGDVFVRRELQVPMKDWFFQLAGGWCGG
jgi:hypothetical protein